MELVMPPVQKASQILSMRFFISPVIIMSVFTLLVLNTLIRKCVNSLIFDAPRTNALTRCRIHTFLYEAQLHCVLQLKSALQIQPRRSVRGGDRYTYSACRRYDTLLIVMLQRLFGRHGMGIISPHYRCGVIERLPLSGNLQKSPVTITLSWLGLFGGRCWFGCFRSVL